MSSSCFTSYSWSRSTGGWIKDDSPAPSTTKELEEDMNCIAKELLRQGYCVDSMSMEGGDVIAKGHDGTPDKKQMWKFERVRPAMERERVRTKVVWKRSVRYE